MSAIKDGRYPITLDKERHLLFSLNVIDEIQEKFGSMTNMSDAISGTDGIKNLKWILTRLLNEGAAEDEPALTEQQVGKMVHTGNMTEVKTAIFAAISMGNRGTAEPMEGEDDEEDDDLGNAGTGKA